MEPPPWQQTALLQNRFFLKDILAGDGYVLSVSLVWEDENID